MLVELENARSDLAALGLHVFANGKPITVILSSRQSDLRDAFPSNISDNGTMGGLTYSFEDRIFVLADMSRPEARKNLLHEFVHAIVGGRFVNVPRWIDEGIAEHYSTLTVRNGEASLGPLDARRRWSQGHCPSTGSLRQILSEEPNALISKSGSGAFYLPAAVVIRYLIEEYGIERVYLMIHAFQEGTSIENAVSKTYGHDIDEIEAAAITSCKSNFVPKEHAVAVQAPITPSLVSDADHQFICAYADILARTFGHQDQAIKKLQDLLKTNASDSFAKRGIGIALLYKKEFDQASTFLMDSWKSLPGDTTTLYHLVIACMNSSNCEAEHYANDVKVLLAAHPYLGEAKAWSAELEEEADGEDSLFLRDEKPEPVKKK